MPKMTMFDMTTSGNFQIHTNRLKIEYLEADNDLSSKLVMSISTTETIRPDMVGNTFYLSFRTDNIKIIDAMIRALKDIRRKKNDELLPEELRI